MARMAGTLDCIGPSGGVVAEGDLHLYAQNFGGVGTVYASGTHIIMLAGREDLDRRGDILISSSGNCRVNSYGNMTVVSPLNDLRMESTWGNTTISGLNIFMHASGNIINNCATTFRIGDSNFEGSHTPNNILVYCEGLSSWQTKQDIIRFQALRDGDADNYNGIYMYPPDTGVVILVTVDGGYIQHQGPPGDVFATNSGLVDFNEDTGMIDANASGIVTYGSHNIELTSAGAIFMSADLTTRFFGASAAYIESDASVFLTAKNIEITGIDPNDVLGDVTIHANQDVEVGDPLFTKDITPLNFVGYASGQIKMVVSDEWGDPTSYGVNIENSNVDLFTYAGMRPTINSSSGIATLDDVDAVPTPWADACFFAYLNADKAVTSSYSSLQWISTIKNGFTHTNGTANITFNRQGRFRIQVYLESDYDIAGHIQSIEVNQMRGILAVPNNLDTEHPTTHRQSCAILDGVIIAEQNDYIWVTAKFTTALAGAVWESSECRVTIFRIDEAI